MSLSIKSRGKVDGFSITEDKNNFVNVNAPNMQRRFGEGKRGVFKVDMETGNIIEIYDSCTLAAISIFLGGASNSSASRTTNGIVGCAKRKTLTAYVYKWVQTTTRKHRHTQHISCSNW